MSYNIKINFQLASSFLTCKLHLHKTMIWPLNELQTSFDFLPSWTCVCCTSCNITFHLHNSLHILCHFSIFFETLSIIMSGIIQCLQIISLRSYFCHLKTFYEHLWYSKFDMEQQMTVYISNFIVFFAREHFVLHLVFISTRGGFLLVPTQLHKTGRFVIFLFSEQEQEHLMWRKL